MEVYEMYVSNLNKFSEDEWAFSVVDQELDVNSPLLLLDYPDNYSIQGKVKTRFGLWNETKVRYIFVGSDDGLDPFHGFGFVAAPSAHDQPDRTKQFGGSSVLVL